MNLPKDKSPSASLRPIKSTIPSLLNKTERSNSIKKPVVRKSSKSDIPNFKDSSKRRTYSIKEKPHDKPLSSPMQVDELADVLPQSTFDKNDVNEPERDPPNANKKQTEPFYLEDQLTHDSLESLMFEAVPISEDRVDVDVVLSDVDDDTEEPTIMECIQKMDKSQKERKTFIKSKLKTDFTSAIISDKSKTERKLLDSRFLNEEIKRNYENEISVLKKQLQLAGLKENPTEDVLIQQCHLLESQLRRSQNDADSLTEQVSGLRSQLQTLPNRIRELEQENELLRGRVEDVRVINHQRQNEVEELHEIVKRLETKLWEQSSGSHHKEKIFLQRLMSEYDNLLKDYDLVKLNHMTSERKIYESRSRISELTSKLSEFEINFRKMEAENNFLKKRFSREKSTYNSWDRDVYPLSFNNFDQNDHFRNELSHDIIAEHSRTPARPKTTIDSTMMSMSCYGALPSYNNQVNSHEAVTPGKRFEHENGRESERYSDNEMIHSAYVKTQRSNVATPTNDRRQVSINEEVQYAKDVPKEDKLPFESSTKSNSVDLMTQQLNRVNNDISGVLQSSMRRQKPDHYRRDSWIDSKNDEERDLERRYDQMQIEKRQLLTNLSHIPINSTARNRRSNRETRENLEAQLDQLDRQLGLMRMTLKQKNILK